MSSGRAIRQLGFRQTIKGAVIIGLLAGFMTTVQGIAYAESYPTDQSRRQFALTLQSAPALGVLYGEPDNLPSPAGYVVYRTVSSLALITAVWGLLTSTKLLRGQEEDGRLEIVAAGNTTLASTTTNLFVGFLTSVIIATLICIAANILINTQAIVGMTIEQSILVGAACFLPALLFSCSGILVSQLSGNRRRALLYGLVPLLVLFALRAIGNTISDYYTLKYISPFGWIELISPVISPQPAWIFAFLAASLVLFLFGYTLCRRRDIGSGILPESNTAKSIFILLRSPFQLAFRQNIPLFLAWTAGAATMSVLMAALATLAVDALSESPALVAIVSQFGGSTDDITIAFIGSGTVFIVMILLVMTTAGIGAIRNDEAKGYLDAVLVQPIYRVGWLLSRTILIAIVALFIALLSTVTTWYVALQQGVTISIVDITLVSIAQTGAVLFTLGFGVFLYGIIPRFAVACMYALITWSLLIDMFQSAITLNDWVVRTSLFHYIPVSITKTPDWTTFAWLCFFAVIMVATGSYAFTRRDIIAE